MRCELLERITTLKPPELATGVARAPLAPSGSDAPLVLPTRLLDVLVCLGALLAEAGCRLDGHHRLARLTVIHRARLREPIAPGTVLVAEAHGVALAPDAARFRTELRLDARLVVEAELTFALEEVNDPSLQRRLAAELERLLGSG